MWNIKKKHSLIKLFKMKTKKFICLFFGLILLIPSVIVIGPMEKQIARSIFLDTMHLSEMSAICLLLFAFFVGAIMTSIGLENMSEKWKAL